MQLFCLMKGVICENKKERVFAMKKVIGLVAVSLVVAVFFCTVGLMRSEAGEKYLPREEIPLYSGGGLGRLGVLVGTEKGIEPERAVTRAEAVVFIMRTLKNDMTEGVHPFEDMLGHWAESYVASFHGQGFIKGTSDTTFSPDRTVTGKEFMKILLSAMGYEGVTLENAYKKGKEYEVLNNNFNASVVYGNYELRRSDVLRICHSVMTSKLADGKRVYEKWIETGEYTTDSFEGILWSGTPAAKSFSGKVNSMMPIDKNYVISPISLKMALSLAANGAEGETREEILQFLEISDLEEYNNKNRELIEKYAQTDAMYLWFANSVWINETSAPGLEFSEDFKKKAQLYYFADSFSVNGKQAPEKINKWVNDKTAGKIEKIIEKADFDAAILNAVYFKASWVNSFRETANTVNVFNSRDGSKKEITFLNNTGYYSYAETEGVRIIELPYTNREEIWDNEGNFLESKRYDELDVGMYILLSDIKVADPEKAIDNGKFNNTYIKLSLPKFKIEHRAELKPVLKQFGVNRAFDVNNAQFALMVNSGNMYIQDVFQKAVIEVNEHGTEAAAVTGIMAGATSSKRPEPIEFRADKPFTFVIRDNISGEILFMGEFAYTE